MATFREITFGESLDLLLAFFAERPPRPIEILVVDDSERALQDALRETLRQRAGAPPSWITTRLIAGPRRGKGAAVRVGARSAVGETVFLIDADLPVPLVHIDEFLETLARTGADVVVAERPRDRYADNVVRRFFAGSLRRIQQTLVFHGPAFEDTQCGFKAFRGDVLESLVDQQLVDGGMYDLEYLYAATLRHLNVQRVKVGISPEMRPSRIKLWRCLVQDPFDIVRFKVAGSLGRYDAGAR